MPQAGAAMLQVRVGDSGGGAPGGARREATTFSITSASSAILGAPRPEALRPGIAPGVLLSVIVDRRSGSAVAFKETMPSVQDGLLPAAARDIGIPAKGLYTPRQIFSGPSS
jgi:hypothetical protein